MKRYKKQKNNDYFLMLSAVLLLIIIGLGIGFSVKKEPTTPAEQTKLKIIGSVVFVIDFGSGKKRSFEGDIVKGETPVDAFIQSSKVGNIVYKFDEKSNLAAVDIFIKNSDKSWHWYLNGKKISKPYEISLHANDKISIKYE